MLSNLRNARVLVAGGSSGIGLATAHAFADAGARVVLAAREGPRLERAAAEVGHGAQTRVFDLLDEHSIAELFKDAEPFDHVAISASSTKSGPVRSLPLEAAEASMNAKFFGAYRIARVAKIAPGGSLTFVSGYLSRRPNASAVLQGAINAALESLARGLALELAPVRVNAVSPGLIATPLYAAMESSERDAMFAAAASRLPVRRVGQAEDVAQAIVFLASNPYVTGSTVLVDGGGSIA
jgi:NAD(P)-dependent dehydrogenase (short-subunit alcohol dehydrogenase family)